MGTSSKAIAIILSDVASKQAGFFTATQAVSAGYADSVHSYHVRNGDWVKVGRGIYRLAGAPKDKWDDLALWSLWSRDREERIQGVYWGITALAVHGLLDFRPRELHMIVPADFRRNSEIPEVLRLRKENLSAEDIEAREGFMVTTLDRTIRDVKTYCTEPKILNILELFRASRQPAVVAAVVTPANDDEVFVQTATGWDPPKAYDDAINRGED